MQGNRLFCQKLQNFPLIAGTDGFGGDLAALHDHQRGNAGNVELHGKIHGLIHIDFADLYICPLPGNLLKNRSDHPAGAAPLGIKVQQDRSAEIQNLGLPVFGIYMNNRHE